MYTLASVSVPKLRQELAKPHVPDQADPSQQALKTHMPPIRVLLNLPILCSSLSPHTVSVFSFFAFASFVNHGFIFDCKLHPDLMMPFNSSVSAAALFNSASSRSLPRINFCSMLTSLLSQRSPAIMSALKSDSNLQPLVFSHAVLSVTVPRNSRLFRSQLFCAFRTCAIAAW